MCFPSGVCTEMTRSKGRLATNTLSMMNNATIIPSMNIRRELALYIGLGIVFSIVATFPLFQHSTYSSNHGDINRGLIFSGIAKESIFAGNLPLWNPYTCGGGPMLADLESWFLQPFFLVTLPFDELLAMKISYALSLFTAFLGFTLLARNVFRFNSLGSLTVGLIMAFGGYISQHIAEGYYVWISSAWIPWFLLAGVQSLKNIRFIPLAGLFLAFMFGAGSMHMVVYSLAFLFLVFVWMPSDKKIYQRALILSGIVLFFILIASIKLLPAIGLFTSDESRLGFTLPISFLPEMLLSRGLVAPIRYNGILYRWGEFGNYIGYGSIFLAALPLIWQRKGLWKQYGAFFFAALVILAIAFTSFPVTHGYMSRITDLFRIPSRLMLFPLLGLALLAGRGIEMIPLRKKIPVLGIVLCIVIAGDLISNDYILFSRMFPLPLPELHQESRFMRVRDAYSTEDESYYRAGYIDFLEKRGINGLCRFYQPKPSTAAINNTSKQKESRGEVYIEDKGAGNTELLQRDNNSLTIHATLTGVSKVVVNMNYYPGWVTQEGLPVENLDGLIAVPLAPGEYTFTLLYHPAAVYRGMIISLLGILFLCIIVFI